MQQSVKGLIPLLKYLSQLCLWAPHRRQSLPAAPADHAGGWALGAPALSESSSAVTRRPLCSYAVESVWGKGGWLPVLCTARAQHQDREWVNTWRLTSVHNHRPHLFLSSLHRGGNITTCISEWQTAGLLVSQFASGLIQVLFVLGVCVKGWLIHQSGWLMAADGTFLDY